jgi:hypothetical protein
MDKENRYLKLSRKDVSEGVEQKGGLDFLSWAYAWNVVSEEYDDANFYFADPVTFHDGTMMVKAVCIVDGKQMEQTLPVMDNRNRAIANPDARAISDAQQRALVKCLSLYGVGIGLYLGKVKHVIEATQYEKAKAFIDSEDSMGLHEYISSLSEKDQIELFNSSPMGTKTDFKNAHRATLKIANDFLTSVSESIASAHESDDHVLLEEVIGELSTYERKAVAGRLSPEQLDFVKQARSKA